MYDERSRSLRNDSRTDSRPPSRPDSRQDSRTDSRSDGRSDGRGNDGRGRGDRRGVPLSELDPALTAVSHKVIGAARDVHMNLGQGFDKSVYVAALRQEFAAQGIAVVEQAKLHPKYKGQSVGEAVCDFFIDGKFLVEVMSHPGEVDSWQRLQLRAKLKAADLELGLILNFGGRLMKDGLVRVLNPDKIKSLRDADGPAYAGPDVASDDVFDDAPPTA